MNQRMNMKGIYMQAFENAFEDLVKQISQQRKRRISQWNRRVCFNIAILIVISICVAFVWAYIVCANGWPRVLVAIVVEAIGIAFIVWSIVSGIRLIMARINCECDMAMWNIVLNIIELYGKDKMINVVDVKTDKEKNELSRIKSVYAIRISVFGVLLFTVIKCYTPTLLQVWHNISELYIIAGLIGVIGGCGFATTIIWMKIHGIHDRIVDLLDLKQMILVSEKPASKGILMSTNTLYVRIGKIYAHAIIWLMRFIRNHYMLLFGAIAALCIIIAAQFHNDDLIKNLFLNMAAGIIVLIISVGLIEPLIKSVWNTVTALVERRVRRFINRFVLSIRPPLGFDYETIIRSAYSEGVWNKMQWQQAIIDGINEMRKSTELNKLDGKSWEALINEFKCAANDIDDMLSMYMVKLNHNQVAALLNIQEQLEFIIMHHNGHENALTDVEVRDITTMADRQQTLSVIGACIQNVLQQLVELNKALSINKDTIRMND